MPMKQIYDLFIARSSAGFQGEEIQQRPSMTDLIKFNVPEECRDFTLFQLLPPEIRDRIWELYLSTPGVHFVKLQTRCGSWRWTESRATGPVAPAVVPAVVDEEDEISNVLKADLHPREEHKACLMPVGPCPKADVSQYTTLRRQLAILSRTCTESRYVVKRLSNRPDTLRVHNGQIISLGRSSDVLYMEYLPSNLYQSNCNLETVPDCPGLQHIKRLSVKFSHTWTPAKEPCSCVACKGRIGRSHGGIYPSHLYQFLARHLPSLEEFFFIDYFIVHKSRCQSVGQEVSKARPYKLRKPRFQAGNRLYLEATPEDWIMNEDVVQITEWLRSSFVRYASESNLSQHKSPEKVRFSVLACEWDIVPPVQRQPVPVRSNSPLFGGALFGGPTKGSRKRLRPSLLGVEVTDNAKTCQVPSGNEDCWRDDNRRREFTFSPIFVPTEQSSNGQVARAQA
ncbi:hypothetical protein QQS21_007203 [Conoideocrella luteorostrata]|uniref:2EXR domain-containing protein n=1 Tax=Conoideocrella luteorostrata TaxID=1105319 RepID=A0AAJ0CP22_9HYPO|nr:hypothetical protein QQS21_007203 [Conoideocrella luteorostrata]